MKRNLSFKIEPEQLALLKNKAEAEDRTLGNVIRRLINDYLSATGEQDNG